MPFGLFNALAQFYSHINKIFAKKLAIFIVIYLDNIVIYTKNLKYSHIKIVQWLLEQLRKHDLYANLKKCQFHKNKI